MPIVADRYQAIIRIEKASGTNCLAAWLMEDVLVASDDQYTWARYPEQSDRLAEQARSMPAERYRLVNNRLVPDGQRVATGQLPELDWQPIASVIQMQLPWIGEAGQVANIRTTTWKLARSGNERAVVGAIVPWRELAKWIETAPQWRLSRLRYCVSESPGGREALILGTPVPPVDAHYLVSEQRILLPAGHSWLPTLPVDYVQRSFGVQPGQWLLWRESDDWCLIDDHLFMPLGRASVRALNNEDSGPR